MKIKYLNYLDICCKYLSGVFSGGYTPLDDGIMAARAGKWQLQWPLQSPSSPAECSSQLPSIHTLIISQHTFSNVVENICCAHN